MAEKVELPEFGFTPRTEQKMSPAGAALPDFAIREPAKAPPSMLKDVGYGLASGLAEGAVALPGLPGSIGQLSDLAIEKAREFAARSAGKFGRLPEGETPESIMAKYREQKQAAMTPAERRGEVYRSAVGIPIPTAYGMVEFAKGAGMPTYKPETVPGKYAKTLGENVPMMFVGPGTRAERVFTGVGGAGGSEFAGQMYEGKPEEGTARFVGSLAGSLLGKAAEVPITARGEKAVTERAGRIAGDILREAESDPKAALQKLYDEMNAQQQGRYVKGFEPTPTQVIGTAEAADLENRIMAIARRQSAVTAAELEGMKAGQREALTSESAMFPGKLQANIPKVDVQSSYGLSGFNPQGEAAVEVKRSIMALEKSMDDNVKSLWGAPQLQSTTLYKNRLMKNIDDFVTGLTESRRTMLDKDAMDVLDKIRSMPGRDVPLREIQDLRSKVLSAARSASDSDDFFRARINNDLAKTLADALNDGTNIVFGDKTGVARDAWNSAREATRKYYETFEPKFVNDLIAETMGGSQKIAGQATFDRMFSGPNAVQNLQEVRKALGTNVDGNVSSWLIGDLTKNGTKVDLKVEDVTKWLADPKKSALVDEIPGLRDRIMNIAQRAGESEAAAMSRQLTEGFQRVIDLKNPKVLSKFLDEHAATLKNMAASPGEAEFIDTMKRSSDILANMPVGKPIVGSRTLDRLADNDIFTILYGRAAGSITDGAATAIAAAIVKKMLGLSLPGLEATAFAAGSSGAAKDAVSRVRNVMNNVVFGNTKEETLNILQRSMSDPALRVALMQKPTAENFENLAQMLARGVERAGATAPKVVTPGAVEQMRERPPRKSGGRVSHETVAEHLVMKAEKHKKAHSKKTEALLEEPDEHIVKALDIAKQHI